MAAGTSIGGFGGGFARGLASALRSNRERQDQKQREAAEAEFRQFSVLNPIAFQAAQDTGDWATYQGFVTRYFPELEKTAKKKGFSFEELGPLLSAPGLQPPTPVGAGQTPAAAAAVGGTSPTVAMPMPAPPGTPAAATAEPPVLPSAAAVAPATPVAPAAAGDPRQNFLGFQMLTPEQRAERETTQEIGKLERTRTAQVGLARKMLPELQRIDPSITLEDALRYVSKGELVTPASRLAAGQTYRYGVDREALAKALYNKPYDGLSREESEVVLAEEKRMLELEAQARGTGTAQARFQAPIDIPTAQASGQPVGTRASDLAGQAVPPLAIAERRRSLDVLKGDLARVQQLINVLPSEATLSGAAPGAVLAVRRRMNSDSGLKDDKGKVLSYRAAIGQLESVIDNMVNVLARTRGEQRGTQTEMDAERAYSAVVKLKAGLSDPLGGDTRESAAARIQETLDGLDRVLAGLPTEPTAKPGAPAAGAQNSAAPTATKDAAGNWIIP